MICKIFAFLFCKYEKQNISLDYKCLFNHIDLKSKLLLRLKGVNWILQKICKKIQSGVDIGIYRYIFLNIDITQFILSYMKIYVHMSSIFYKFIRKTKRLVKLNWF